MTNTTDFTGKRLERISVSVKREDGKSIRSIDLNMLSILTGPNGSGKTMMLVSSFFISEIGNLVCLGLEKETLKEMANFIFSSTYKENLSGFIKGDFEGSVVTVYLEEGLVTSVVTEDWEAKQVPLVTYMSAHMRTFEAISHYLLVRKMLSSLPEELKFKELCENFKLYDVKYIESVIQRMPMIVDSDFRDALKKFDIKDEIETIDVDLEKCDFFYKVKDSEQKHFMKSKGSGEQSIMNMLIGNSR